MQENCNPMLTSLKLTSLKLTSLKLTWLKLAWLKLTFAAFALTCAMPAGAQEFAGKTVTIYIGNTAGGTYDLMGRLVARHLGRHLPGHPTVIAENMPGAGTLRAANFIANVAPKNGTALGIVSESLAIEQALRNAAVQYDAAKL